MKQSQSDLNQFKNRSQTRLLGEIHINFKSFFGIKFDSRLLKTNSFLQSDTLLCKTGFTRVRNLPRDGRSARISAQALISESIVLLSRIF